MNNKNNNGFLRNAFLYIIVIIAVVTGVQYFAGGSQSPSQQLSYTQLVKKIEDGKVKSITYQPDGSIIEVKGSYKKAEKVDTDLSLPFLGSASSETRSFTSTVLQNETTMQKLRCQLRTSEHRSMYSYVRLSIDRCTASTSEHHRCTARR